MLQWGSGTARALNPGGRQGHGLAARLKESPATFGGGSLHSPARGAMLPSLHRRQAGFRRSFSLNGPRAAAQKPAVVRQRAPSCLTHGEQQRRQPRCRLSASIPSLVPRRWVRKLRHWALDCSQAVATSVLDLALQRGFAETRLAAASHRLAMVFNGGMARDGCPARKCMRQPTPGPDLVVQHRSPAAAQTLSRGMHVDHSSRCTTDAAGSHPTALISIKPDGILHSGARSPDSPKGTECLSRDGGVEYLQTKNIVDLNE
jgi:hypothetical protein